MEELMTGKDFKKSRREFLTKSMADMAGVSFLSSFIKVKSQARGKTMVRILIILVLLCSHLIVMAQSTNKAPWPTKEWARSMPTEQKLNPKLLNELVQLIREEKTFPDLHSLLIVRNGYLVVEEYFDGYHADRIHTLQSVSKSFTSALIGIAIEQGKIKGVQERALDFFPDIHEIQNMDERKAAIKLQDLLTMRSGTDYHEGYSGSPHDKLNHLDRGWDRFYLNRKMLCKPGTRFQYDSGGVILMSSILKSRTGMHADSFAEKYLFIPLGIKNVMWHRNQEGHPHTGGGLSLLPRDMAKFGLLYLRKGRWENRQVVPADWVEESFQKRISFNGRSSDREIGYGYLWWILMPDLVGAGKQNIFAAMGFRAQYIFIIPEHDMVVLVTGGTASHSDQKRPISFLYSHILPAVHQ